ncbi:unnamed protein product [Caenorhabditis angaria]|uniref:G protein-coupled receptor n=1 Tax=Caenorhabditis angaria TaxID=860376 RepID=A0A9P1NAE7_9PELO|nr:unnamed protein product [Caenorhabditis angaria]
MFYSSPGLFTSIVCLLANRYFQLTSRSRYSPHFQVSIYILHYIFAAFYACFIIRNVPEQTLALERAHQILPCLPDSIKSMRIEVINNDPIDAIKKASFFSFIVTLEITIFALLIYHKLYQSRNNTLSLSTRKMQKSFFIAICVQIIVPLTLLALPLLCFSYCSFNTIYNQSK